MCEEQQYLDLLADILENGVLYHNRTGVDTKAVFGRMMRFNLKETFPILTTRKIFFRGVFEELMFFLRGDTNSKHLEEKGVYIWKGNTSRDFLDSRGLDYLIEGELGCAYSHQWRNFSGEHSLIPETKGLKGVDQVARVIDQIKNDPTSRRIYIVGVNPSQERFMALPSCHNYCQFIANPNTKELNCFFQVRSNDATLGLGFNCSQYALLLFLIAAVTGYTPNDLVYAGVDVHIYSTHFDAVRKQLKREPRPFPRLELKKKIDSLDDLESLQYDDVSLIGYNPHPNIKMDMVI